MKRKTISSILAVTAPAAGATAKADPLEIFSWLDARNEIQVSGKMGGEFVDSFPGQTFLVGVEPRLGNMADIAVCSYGFSADKEEPLDVANADARMEIIFRHRFTHWSLFAQAGERAQWQHDSDEFTKAYGYVQIGLAGAYY